MSTGVRPIEIRLVLSFMDMDDLYTSLLSPIKECSRTGLGMDEGSILTSRIHRSVSAVSG